MNKRKPIKARDLTILALLAAVAYVVMFLSKLIPVNVLGFLNFDLKDVIICIAGFLFGPLAAAGISFVVSLIEMVTVSSTGLWGLLMNVLSTCAFVCTAAVIYQRNKSIKSAVVGLVAGVLLMTVVMLLWNYLITPIYMGQPRELVATLLIPYFLPFNPLQRQGRQEQAGRRAGRRRPARHLRSAGAGARKSDLRWERRK